MFSEAKRAHAAREFAHLGETIYLNTSLACVPPLCVQRAYRAEMRRFVASVGDESGFAEDAQRARCGLARLIGADEGEIALTNNTTAGIDVISLGWPWEKGDEVVLYEREHPSNRINWMLREAGGKLRLRWVKAGPGGLRADDLIAAMGEKTRAVAVSWVQYTDGARVDLARLGAACRAAGALLIVDAIQGLGRLAMDVREMGVDFLACGCHKGLLVRNGVGFLYCRAALLDRLVPFNGSYQSIAQPLHPGAFPRWHAGARRFENGNHNNPGVFALTAALNLLQKLGKRDIEAEILRLFKALRVRLRLTGHDIRPAGDMPSGVFRLPFAAGRREEARAVLGRAKISGTLREDHLRLCINFFNTDAQMETLARTAAELL
jgi:selenocysteine lyase/cysteine desulfurase